MKRADNFTQKLHIGSQRSSLQSRTGRLLSYFVCARAHVHVGGIPLWRARVSSCRIRSQIRPLCSCNPVVTAVCDSWIHLLLYLIYHTTVVLQSHLTVIQILQNVRQTATPSVTRVQIAPRQAAIVTVNRGRKLLPLRSNTTILWIPRRQTSIAL